MTHRSPHAADADTSAAGDLAHRQVAGSSFHDAAHDDLEGGAFVLGKLTRQGGGEWVGSGYVLAAPSGAQAIGGLWCPPARRERP